MLSLTLIIHHFPPQLHRTWVSIKKKLGHPIQKRSALCVNQIHSSDPRKQDQTHSHQNISLQSGELNSTFYFSCKNFPSKEQARLVLGCVESLRAAWRLKAALDHTVLLCGGGTERGKSRAATRSSDKLRSDPGFKHISNQQGKVSRELRGCWQGAHRRGQESQLWRALGTVHTKTLPPDPHWVAGMCHMLRGQSDWTVTSVGACLSLPHNVGGRR